MEKFVCVQSRVVPLDRANVDTDQIIPKQFLRSISRLGFGQFLFDEWRYADRGELGMDCATRPKNADFVLNQPLYQPPESAQILLAQDNFGCGSSREHAVWALMQYGFRVVIAPSFGDIFRNNAYKNGLLPIACERAVAERLFALAAEKAQNENSDGLTLAVDLTAQTFTTVAVADASPPAESWSFAIDSAHKQSLLEGVDDIARTLQRANVIRAYEQKRRQTEPWLFDSPVRLTR